MLSIVRLEDRIMATDRTNALYARMYFIKWNGFILDSLNNGFSRRHVFSLLQSKGLPSSVSFSDFLKFCRENQETVVFEG